VPPMRARFRTSRWMFAGEGEWVLTTRMSRIPD
jgi:hypothetical protein